ncbi:MAG: YjbH domain-containing protein [Alphaproteobacteria bacterium]|nr:YjbH domain-containing protein [Alphaproteobacteria bacterium]
MLTAQKPVFRKFYLAFTCAVLLAGTAGTGQAENLPASPTLYGPLGLNTVPSARMDTPGTLRAGVSYADPYAHSWLSFQFAPAFSLSLRQSAEISSLKNSAKRLYPGIDTKIRLIEESRARPEIALGLQSAIGHKRLAAEYIAASKRYGNFDFTAGLGWGRMGSAAHLKNPLSVLSKHFDKDRNFLSENANGPTNWFTGEDIGLFGGLEYHTPWNGLSLKLDYGADNYSAERLTSDYKAPAPWSVGLNYRPAPWANFGIGMQGTNKIMARLSFNGNLEDWPVKNADTSKSKHSVVYYKANIEAGKPADIEILRTHNTPQQLRYALSQTKEKSVSFIPRVLGLRGPQIHMINEHLQSKSAEEIWHETEFEGNTPGQTPTTNRPSWTQRLIKEFRVSLQTKMGISEKEATLLERSSLTAGTQGPSAFGFLNSFASLRLNLSNHLQNIPLLNPAGRSDLRANEHLFAAKRLALDTAFLNATHSFSSNLHTSINAGYLEEMYAGAGGEILYRPYNARWALGAESWLAYKRDPTSPLNLDFKNQHLFSGFINGWYDIPGWDLTAKASLGQYLGHDKGVTLGLQKNFKNGVKLEGFITASNQNEHDLFGGETNTIQGLRLSMPLGNIKYLPQNTNADIFATQFNKNIGQKLENPLPLYDLTAPFSMRHITAHWQDIKE